MILTILRIPLLRLRNNPLELALVFVMPVVFFTIFAGIFSKGIATGNDKKLRIGWIAAHETALSRELRAFLETNSTLQCSSLLVAASGAPLRNEPAADSADATQPDESPMQATIAEAQRSGRYDLIIKLPEDFPARLPQADDSATCAVQLVTDGQNPLAVAMVTSVVRGFFTQKKAAAAGEQMTSLRLSPESFSGDRLLREAGEVQYFEPIKAPAQFFQSDAESRWLLTDSHAVHALDGVSIIPKAWPLAPLQTAFAAAQPRTTLLANTTASPHDDAVRIRVENPQAATQENPRIAMYAAGIAVLFLLFSSTGNAAALLEEAESGTLDRILVSQAGLLHIVGGKWLSILLLGCLQITVMFVWAELVFRIQLARHVGGFCIMTFSTAAATASFAMLLATLCKSRAQLNAISVVIILSMSAVGGSMIPRFAMSDRMQDIGRWTFNAWALDGYQKVFWFQTPLSSLRNEVAVLLGSSLVLGALTLLCSGRWKRG